MSAVVVTIQVQLSVHSCYLIYSLSHSVDSETFSGRKQSIGYALAVTLNPSIRSILWGHSSGFAQDTYGARLAQV